ncbi:amino acid permease [Enterococcus diestrammenae]|uniref:Amino acid permease n=1 Tax=Enterococcus diestrammenae TaxID=1155073 RepID=A0ABV0F7T4_9ENTE|nr:amino acid permease [Enterococcus diestrammenae]KAF1300716.1 amino acid permease [Enterococcus diestrammenae]HIX70043.1 amino acid permease [Candidatus Enterococcus stercoravium]
MEQQELSRSLKNRHVQLISIGGAIGTGLFLGSGKSIQQTGPSILLAYMITGGICFLIMRALGELLLSNTNNHSFLDFVAEYLGKKWAFLTGWTYWFCWIAISMADLTAMGMYVRYWFPNIPQWLPEICALILLVALNLITVSLFGELEFWFALIKVVAIVALIGVGAYMILTNYPTSAGSVKLSNIWTHGGWFPKGIKGFLLSFQMVTFAFVGIEMVGLVAGETKDPEKVLPEAINNIPIRIILFYLGSLLVIMAIYPWDSLDTSQSPFVEVFSEIGITMAATIINVVVLSAAASACNSAIYSTGRMMRSLAQEGSAPKSFVKLTKHQVPANAIFFSAMVIFMAVVLNYVMPSQVFTVITSIATTCFLFIWGILTYTHMKYRRSIRGKQAHSFKMPFYPLSNYLIFAFLLFVAIVLLWSNETRIAALITPAWFLLLRGIYYVKYEKRASDD